MAAFLVSALIGYACGSIPVGVLLARSAGVDPRQAGSGNIGATNVARTAGRGLGLATLAGDALKGIVPVLIAGRLWHDASVAATAGLAAFLGHVFPFTLGFAGGKGVATALGVLAMLCPLALLSAFGMFVAVFARWRYVSLASVVAAASAPLAIAALGCSRASLVAGLAMTVVVIARHADNLRRLRAGTEPTFGLLKKQASLSD